MSGKILAGAIVAIALIFGAAVYYFQIYYYYTAYPVAAEQDISLASVSGGSEQITVRDFHAIDAQSSPIRYRACFKTDQDLDQWAQRFAPYEPEQAEYGPRNAPGWFDCFDAEAIGEQIETGAAQVFLAQRNIQFGIDKVVAVTNDGTGYIWHELNACGEKAYDGTPLGTDCPPRD